MFNPKDYFYPYELLKLRRFLNKSERFSKEELINFQNKKLQGIIHYAYDNVLYYKELFDNNGINPNDIQSTQDLQIVPVLTKDILRERFNDLISIQYKKYRIYINQTSGSTGTPLKFYQDKNVNIAKFCFFWRVWNWTGYRIGQKMAQLEGKMFKNTLFKHDYFLNALRISGCNLSKENSKVILKKLTEYNPAMIRGFPSSLYEFSKFIGNDVSLNKLKSLKTIVLYSESLFDFQREHIEKTFNCKVFDCYHQWESVCMISECSEQTKHHQMEYGVLELLDEQNKSVPDGRIGEMVATGFYNLAMPLIRFKTGDLSSKSTKKCSCGIEHDTVGSIDGRIEDMVITPDGRSINSLGNAFVFNKGFDFIQIIQNAINSIEINLIKNNNFDENELELLNQNLRKRIGNEMKISFNFVNKIDRQPNGKIRLVINNSIPNRALAI